MMESEPELTKTSKHQGDQIYNTEPGRYTLPLRKDLMIRLLDTLNHCL